ncbi:MAG: hypothetical protein ACYDHT_08555 [Solirubrobacteraceae bacterium]
MLGKRQMTHRRVQARSAGAIVATAAALGGFASFAAPGMASDTIKVGVGEASIVVNGTTISTSNLTIAQLAKLQGVPAATVQAELDGVAANTPAASAVEALIAGLPLETTLATALNSLSGATGGLISPQAALRQIIEDEGTPGAAGGNGANGGNGSGGAAGANGSGAGAAAGTPGASPAKKRLSLRAGSRSLKGRPGKKVRVPFTVSSAAKLSYSGRKLAKGSRSVKPGASSLMVTLPRKHGNYQLLLKAVGADGQIAQTTVALHDAVAKAKKGHH